VPCEYEGAPLEVGFSGRYMLEILAQCGGELATFHLRDSGSPVRVTHCEDSATDFVLMPMRV
jgi:DNA polymerase-3 subunit beta